MLFAAHCIDKPNSTALRAATRDAHLVWLKQHLGKIVVGGPYLAADGVTITGSLMVIKAPDEASARAMFAGEPFVKSGLFASIDIRPFRWSTNVGGTNV
jgi:uncharacterized protein YciI